MTTTKTLQDVSQHTLKGSLLHKIVGDLREKESAVAYLPTAYTPAAALLLQEVTIEVQDAAGDKLRVSDEKTDEKAGITQVQVDISGGTATGKQLQLLNKDAAAIDGSVIVPLEKGVGKVFVLAASTGTVTLALTDSQGHGLTVTSTATVTFS